jgi:hypothetical protein
MVLSHCARSTMNVDRLATRGGALAAEIESRTGQIMEALRTSTTRSWHRRVGSKAGPG